MIANSRGFQSLAGAASLKYRMPAIVDTFPLLDVAQMVEQQPGKLSVAGSNPRKPMVLDKASSNNQLNRAPLLPA